MIYNEQETKQLFINALVKKGYEYISEQQNKEFRNEILSQQYLNNSKIIEALKKINNISNETIVVECLKKLFKVPRDKSLSEQNKILSERLFSGVDFTDENNKNKTFKFFDFKNIGNNIFYVTEEFSFFETFAKDKIKNNIFDLVCFINGIPIICVEVKDPNKKIENAIEQMHRYYNENPTFFSSIQITAVFNELHFLYSTSGANINQWYKWKYEQKCQISSHNIDSQTWILFIDHILNTKNVLNFMSNYICHNKEGHYKIISRFNQFWATELVMQKIINSADASNINSSLWHYQGTGKSMIMVFIAKQLFNKWNDSKIIIASDRKSLDDQNANNFSQTLFYQSTPISNIAKAQSKSQLISLINDSSKKVIAATIQKSTESIVLDKKNIFIFIDEAHRTQYGKLHKLLKHMFPRASLIGFTGTPINKVDKNTVNVFDEIIHRYLIKEAIADKVVVPFIYQNWPESIILNDNDPDKLLQIIRKKYKLNQNQIKDIEKKIQRYGYISGNTNIMLSKVLAIQKHMNESIIKPDGHAGILVTTSREIAVKYYYLFKEKTNIKVAITITPDTDNKLSSSSEEMQKWFNDEFFPNKKNYDTLVKQKVRNNETDLIIVCDKFLTGYDEPRLQVIYLDKKIDEQHTLLQAIARINRTNTENKEYGIIVDFKGQIENIIKGLASYSENNSLEQFRIIPTPADIKARLKRTEQEVISIINQKTNISPSYSKDHNNTIASAFSKKDEKSKKESNELQSKIYQLIKTFKAAKSCANVNYEDINWNYYENLIRDLMIIRNEINIKLGREADLNLSMRREIQSFVEQCYSSEKDILSPSTSQIELNSEEYQKIINSKSTRISRANYQERIIKDHIQKCEDSFYNKEFYANLKNKLEQLILEHNLKQISTDYFLKQLEKISKKIAGSEKNPILVSGIETKYQQWTYNVLNKLLSGEEDQIKATKIIDEFAKEKITKDIYFDKQSIKYKKTREELIKLFSQNKFQLNIKLSNKEKTKYFEELFNTLQNYG